MSKTTQIARISFNGYTYRIIENSDDVNRYWVYKCWNDYDTVNGVRKRRMLVDKWACMNDALLCVASEINNRPMALVPFEAMYG